jgi:hypothetical protein
MRGLVVSIGRQAEERIELEKLVHADIAHVLLQPGCDLLAEIERKTA